MAELLLKGVVARRSCPSHSCQCWLRFSSPAVQQSNGGPPNRPPRRSCPALLVAGYGSNSPSGPNRPPKRSCPIHLSPLEPFRPRWAYERKDYEYVMGVILSLGGVSVFVSLFVYACVYVCVYPRLVMIVSKYLSILRSIRACEVCGV